MYGYNGGSSSIGPYCHCRNKFRNIFTFISPFIRLRVRRLASASILPSVHQNSFPSSSENNGITLMNHECVIFHGRLALLIIEISDMYIYLAGSCLLDASMCVQLWLICFYIFIKAFLLHLFIYSLIFEGSDEIFMNLL